MTTHRTVPSLAVLVTNTWKPRLVTSASSTLTVVDHGRSTTSTAAASSPSQFSLLNWISAWSTPSPSIVTSNSTAPNYTRLREERAATPMPSASGRGYRSRSTAARDSGAKDEPNSKSGQVGPTTGVLARGDQTGRPGRRGTSKALSTNAPGECNQALNGPIRVPSSAIA